MATNQGMYYYTKEEIDELNTDQSTYSTTEKAVGTWIDGSTIYRKTIEFGSLPNATTKNVAHNISNLSHVVKVEAIAKSGTRFFPLPSAQPDSLTYIIRVTVEGSNINIVTGADRSDFNAYVTLYYTKLETSS